MVTKEINQRATAVGCVTVDWLIVFCGAGVHVAWKINKKNSRTQVVRAFALRDYSLGTPIRFQTTLPQPLTGKV
jgi:hypothetical protein